MIGGLLEKRSFAFFAAFAARFVMQRNNASANRTGVFLALFFHEFRKSPLLYEQTIFPQACFVMKTVAFFQSIDLLTGIPRTFVTIGNEFFSDAAFDSAFSAMRRLFSLVCKTAAAGLRMQTVPITYPAIHSAGGE